MGFAHINEEMESGRSWRHFIRPLHDSGEGGAISSGIGDKERRESGSGMLMFGEWLHLQKDRQQRRGAGHIEETGRGMLIAEGGCTAGSGVNRDGEGHSED